MIDEAESRSRRDAVDAAVASARIAGVATSPEAAALFEGYAAGEIDADEMMRRALAIWGPNEKSPPG